MSQKTKLLSKPTLVRIAHPLASLPVMDVTTLNIYPTEAFLPMSFLSSSLHRF
jgi:hypothetical protein